MPEPRTETPTEGSTIMSNDVLVQRFLTVKLDTHNLGRTTDMRLTSSSQTTTTTPLLQLSLSSRITSLCIRPRQ